MIDLPWDIISQVQQKPSPWEPVENMVGSRKD